MTSRKMQTGSSPSSSMCVEETATLWTLGFLSCPLPFTYCSTCCLTLTLLPCHTSIFSHSLFPSSDSTFLPFPSQSKVEGLCKKGRDFSSRKNVPWWATTSTSKKERKTKTPSITKDSKLFSCSFSLSFLSPPRGFSLSLSHTGASAVIQMRKEDNQPVLSVGTFLSQGSATPSCLLQPLSSKPKVGFSLLRPSHSSLESLFPNPRIPVPVQMDFTQSLALEGSTIPFKAASRGQEPLKTFPLEVLLYLVGFIYSSLNTDSTPILLKLTFLCWPGNLVTFLSAHFFFLLIFIYSIYFFNKEPKNCFRRYPIQPYFDKGDQCIAPTQLDGYHWR